MVSDNPSKTPAILTPDENGRVVDVAVDVLYCETVGTPAWDFVREHCFRHERRRNEIEELREEVEPLCLDRNGTPLNDEDLAEFECDLRRVAKKLLEDGRLTLWSEWDRLQTGICS